MGVYNPNMEMPSNCTECIEFKDDCEHYWDYYCTHESRPNDCPLTEIVTCGECKWWNRDGKRKDGKGWCENAICGLTKPNAFCSYGERRADVSNGDLR